MLIFPAIDIKNGECVRLYKGEFDTAHKVASDPFETAVSFKNSGASVLHMVDLDGALGGVPKNLELVCDTAKKSGLACEAGGGIRNMQTVEEYLSKGISRVILGTSAINDKEFLKEALLKYGDKIAVGIDAKDEMVCVNGWTESGNIHYIKFAKTVEQLGTKYIIFTDISTDGTLNGPNLEQLSNITNAVDCNIIASGGIRDIGNVDDVYNLGVYGVICGKSIYSGTLNLKEAIDKYELASNK